MVGRTAGARCHSTKVCEIVVCNQENNPHANNVDELPIYVVTFFVVVL